MADAILEVHLPDAGAEKSADLAPDVLVRDDSQSAVPDAQQWAALGGAASESEPYTPDVGQFAERSCVVRAEAAAA